jgi:hypothetical protein
MFDIGVCEAKQVALIRFSGELTESDFTQLDRLAADARGNAAGFDCIFDFTAIERLDLATEFVARRGSGRPEAPDEALRGLSDRERMARSGDRGHPG